MGEMKKFQKFSSSIKEAEVCSCHDRTQVVRGALGASLL